MKITKEYEKCPDCNGEFSVVSMKSGNVYMFLCLRCHNSLGLFKNASAAKKAWLTYCERKKK